MGSGMRWTSDWAKMASTIFFVGRMKPYDAATRRAVMRFMGVRRKSSFEPTAR